MNPIFYFDELDKISRTTRGEEITNLLIHLTDDSQNNKFQDKYYSGIDLNISRAIFVFSFNDLTLVNPILRDRLNILKLEGFNSPEKLTISKNYLLKNIMREFETDDITFTTDALKYIISEYSDEQGVRELKRKIKDIVSRINLIQVSNGNLFDLGVLNKDLLNIPIKLTVKLAKKLLE
jgi:ATP-dependent Lon protease